MLSQTGITGKQVMVVTGGAGRLGLMTAQFYLNKGMSVILVDRNLLALERAIDVLGQQDLYCIAADITQSVDTQRYISEIYRRFGMIDTFIHCIGMSARVRPIVEIPEEDFLYKNYHHFTGIWLAFQYVLPKINRDGRFIIVSGSGKCEFEYDTPAQDKKAQLRKLIKRFSKEVSNSNISICTVDPMSFEGVLTASTRKIQRLNLEAGMKNNAS